MPRLEPSRRFEKALARIARRDAARFRRIVKALQLFSVDIHHPGLNFEKLKGTDHCTIRVSQGDRLMVRQSATDTFEIIDIVDHDTMARRYG